MLRPLILHPDSRCAAAAGIDAEAIRPRPGALALRYVVSRNIAGLRIPPVAAPERTGGLWRHTCFEAFIGVSPDGPYCEFNFAPSTEWAAWRFEGYRSGMRDVPGLATPRIEPLPRDDRFEIRVSLAPCGLADLPDDAAWRCGLSAVIEAADGTLSYWALAHPPGKPDFHHSDCFALELPAA